MADSVVKQDPDAMPSVQDDATPIVAEEPKVDVSVEQVSTEEQKSEEQSAVKTEIETVAQQSRLVEEHGGDATGDKTEENGTSEPVKKEDTDEKSAGHRKGPYKRRNNSKFDPSVAEISSDPVEIRKQVEFYFSDSNLPMDKFLFAKVGGVENRPIGLKMIATFKRMKRFQPYEAIVAALKDSDFLDLTENEEVKRKVPLESNATGKTISEAHQKWEDKSMDRSIYAKGFGEETPTTQFEIEAFFAPYGPTNAIRLRRMADRTFKGSVFVEFQDSATQQKFLALEPKPKWKSEVDLMWKSKREYVDEKERDIKAGKIKPYPSWKPQGNGRKGGVDQDDWNKRREQDQKSGFRNNRNGRGGRGGRGGHGAKPPGRGERGGRGGRGGRGNGYGRREKDTHQVPKIHTSTPEEAPPPKDYVPPVSTDISPEGSKKRTREDDDVAEDIAEKKIKIESTPKTEVKTEVKIEDGE